MSYNIVKHRRGTTKEWQEVNLVPENGELVIEECINGTRKCKIGNGVLRFTDLPYIDEDVYKKLAKELSSTKDLLDNELIELNSSLTNKIEAAENRLNEAIINVEEKANQDSLEAVSVVRDDFNKSLNELISPSP